MCLIPATQFSCYLDYQGISKGIFKMSMPTLHLCPVKRPVILCLLCCRGPTSIEEAMAIVQAALAGKQHKKKHKKEKSKKHKKEKKSSSSRKHRHKSHRRRSGAGSGSSDSSSSDSRG